MVGREQRIGSSSIASGCICAQMLAKPFSIMDPSDWDNAPRNINGVEKANACAKSGHK